MQPIFFEHYTFIIQVHVSLNEVLSSIRARVNPFMAAIEALVCCVWRVIHELILILPTTSFAFKFIAACGLNTIKFLVTRAMVHKGSPRWDMLLVHEKRFLVKPLLDNLLLPPLLVDRTRVREMVFALLCDCLCSLILAEEVASLVRV